MQRRRGEGKGIEGIREESEDEQPASPEPQGPEPPGAQRGLERRVYGRDVLQIGGDGRVGGGGQRLDDHGNGMQRGELRNALFTGFSQVFLAFPTHGKN
jgi:hypothetical protein